MENIFNPDIQCTDPDQLQFCLKISDKEFWYCQANVFHPLLYADAGTTERAIYDLYSGYPKQLLLDAQNDKEVMEFVTNRQIWLTGSSEMDDFTQAEQLELLDDYGYKWDDFKSDAERNQIICENFFEQNPMDFRNDI